MTGIVHLWGKGKNKTVICIYMGAYPHPCSVVHSGAGEEGKLIKPWPKGKNTIFVFLCSFYFKKICEVRNTVYYLVKK